MTVRAILSHKGTAVVTAAPTARLCDTIEILDEQRIGAVVITDAEQQVVGILTERDVLRALARKARSAGACQICDEPVGQVMTREIETCTPADTVYQIMQRMTEKRFRHLPVIENGRLAGIVSIGDVVKHRIRQMEFESDAMHQYVLGA